MRLMIIESNQAHTLLDAITIKWDGKTNSFTTFCADGDYAKIRLASPLLVKSVVNELKTLGNAEIEGAIAWNGANSDEFDENRENEKSDCDTMTVDQVKHSVESSDMDNPQITWPFISRIILLCITILLGTFVFMLARYVGHVAGLN